MLCGSSILFNVSLSFQVRSDDDDDVDIGKLKSVMIFLDAALCALEQQTQRSVVDELCDDILEIFLTLLLWCKLCQLKIMDSEVHTVSAEDSLLLSEAIMKLLAVAEMLIQTKGTKTSLKELLSAPNASIR